MARAFTHKIKLEFDGIEEFDRRIRAIMQNQELKLKFAPVDLKAFETSLTRTLSTAVLTAFKTNKTQLQALIGVQADPEKALKAFQVQLAKIVGELGRTLTPAQLAAKFSPEIQAIRRPGITQVVPRQRLAEIRARVEQERRDRQIARSIMRRRFGREAISLFDDPSFKRLKKEQDARLRGEAALRKERTAKEQKINKALSALSKERKKVEQEFINAAKRLAGEIASIQPSVGNRRLQGVLRAAPDITGSALLQSDEVSSVPTEVLQRRTKAFQEQANRIRLLKLRDKSLRKAEELRKRTAEEAFRKEAELNRERFRLTQLQRQLIKELQLLLKQPKFQNENIRGSLERELSDLKAISGKRFTPEEAKQFALVKQKRLEKFRTLRIEEEVLSSLKKQTQEVSKELQLEQQIVRTLKEKGKTAELGSRKTRFLARLSAGFLGPERASKLKNFSLGEIARARYAQAGTLERFTLRHAAFSPFAKRKAPLHLRALGIMFVAQITAQYIQDIFSRGLQAETVATMFRAMKPKGADKFFAALTATMLGQTVSEMSRKQVSSKLTAAKLPIKAQEFASVAEKISILGGAQGYSAEDSLNRLITAILEGSREQIDRILPSLNFREQISELEKRRGVRFTEEERVRARFEIIREQLNKSNVPDSLADSVKSMQSLQAAWTDFMNEFSRGVATSQEFRDALKGVLQTFIDNKDAIMGILTGTVKILATGIKYANIILKAYAAYKGITTGATIGGVVGGVIGTAFGQTTLGTAIGSKIGGLAGGVAGYVTADNILSSEEADREIQQAVTEASKVTAANAAKKAAAAANRAAAIPQVN